MKTGVWLVVVCVLAGCTPEPRVAPPVCKEVFNLYDSMIRRANGTYAKIFEKGKANFQEDLDALLKDETKGDSDVLRLCKLKLEEEKELEEKSSQGGIFK